MKQIPTSVNDTNDFMNKVTDLRVPKYSILVSLDVKTFYTNIPNAESTAAVRFAHVISTKKCSNKSTNNFPCTISYSKQIYFRLDTLFTD